MSRSRYLPLSCPQISTAYIMTSQPSALAGGLSLKKQSHTTSILSNQSAE